MKNIVIRVVKRSLNRIKKRVKNTNKILSNLFINKIKISSNLNIQNNILCNNEIFSCINPDYSYTGAIPYWLDINEINLRNIGISYQQTQVIGKGILINENDEVILESTIGQLEYLNKLNSNHLVFFKDFFYAKKISKAIVLSNYLENNYYHWLLESIGRLSIISKEKLKEHKIILDKKSEVFIKDSLFELFGIDPGNIIYKKKYSRLKIKCTLIPSFPLTRNEQTESTNIYSPYVIKKINEISKGKTLSSKKRNFIISRDKATQRRIKNQNILLSKFPSLNFEIIVLENLTFKDQMELFANSNIIIATHGAGLANLLFSKESMVIEFFPSNRLKRDAFYFYQISQALNLKHYLIEYESLSHSQDLELKKEMIVTIEKIFIENGYIS